MEFTLATLEDNLGAIKPTSQEIANFLQTMKKEELVETFNKLPDYQREAICPCVSGAGNNGMFASDTTKIAVSGIAGVGIGYAVYGVGGAIIGGLLSGGIAYYLTNKQ
jgi:hypothetical protein